jgi:hypothetical protein
MYKDLKATVIAEYKLQEFTQRGLVIDYTIQFQMYVI